MSAHLTFRLPVLAELVGASTDRAHVEIGERAYGSHRIHFGDTLDACEPGSVVVDLGMLPPDVRTFADDEFVAVGDFAAEQIRSALALDGIAWEAS